MNAASVFILEDATTLTPLAFKQCLKVLSDTEKQRFNKMRSLKRRQQFAISRFLLKISIEQQLGVRVILDTSSTGQPVINGWPAFCSISHSGNSIAVGFSTYGAIGVDIEQHRQRKIDRLIKHYFHHDETKDFNALSENQKLPWFYRQWTIKEAVMKSTGEGLSFTNLSRKVTRIDGNIYTFTSFNKGCNYNLACVHHSNQPLQLANITFKKDYPWLEASSQPLCKVNHIEELQILPS